MCLWKRLYLQITNMFLQESQLWKFKCSMIIKEFFEHKSVHMYIAQNAISFQQELNVSIYFLLYFCFLFLLHHLWLFHLIISRLRVMFPWQYLHVWHVILNKSVALKCFITWENKRKFHWYGFQGNNSAWK